ncbi:unnamed protein product, partial [Allacma fusca]
KIQESDHTGVSNMKGSIQYWSDQFYKYRENRRPLRKDRTS